MKQQRVSQKCKIRISLFGSFQKAKFCHEGDKFHPCILNFGASECEIFWSWSLGFSPGILMSLLSTKKLKIENKIVRYQINSELSCIIVCTVSHP